MPARGPLDCLPFWGVFAATVGVVLLLHESMETPLAAVEPGHLQQGVARSEELQQHLWAEAVAVGQKEPGSLMVACSLPR